jgi:hypothetical protein
MVHLPGPEPLKAQLQAACLADGGTFRGILHFDTLINYLISISYVAYIWEALPRQFRVFCGPRSIAASSKNRRARRATRHDGGGPAGMDCQHDELRYSDRLCCPVRIPSIKPDLAETIGNILRGAEDSQQFRGRAGGARFCHDLTNRALSALDELAQRGRLHMHASKASSAYLPIYSSCNSGL